MASQDGMSGAAAILSFLIPGLGQLCKEQFGKGLGWFALVVVAYIVFIPLGFAMHILCVMDAYNH